MHPSVRARPGAIEITDDRVFGPGRGALARRFARCVLQFNEVRSLALDPARETASVNYRLATSDPGVFLTQLASAVAAPRAGVNETELPHWTNGMPVILYRHSSVISIFEKLHIGNGYLTIRHPALERGKAIARKVENALRVVPGVIRTTVTGKLKVRFDPRAVAVAHLIRLTEAKTFEQLIGVTAPASKQVDFALANVSVGAAAVSDLILPPMMPATAALLVVSNLATFGAAADQLRRGEIGLPLLYTSIVGVTLASGQFLSAALMLWCFRYWEGRYRHDLKVENQALLDDSVGLPEEVRMLTADGSERMVPSSEIHVGQRIGVRTGETVPIDAIVRAGAALVDQSALSGTLAPNRKVIGDRVLAGSKLLAGAVELEVLHMGQETRAARIAQALSETTAPRPRSEALNRDAEDFAAQAVAPTLLAAGASLLVGDATTAGAILRPDYATGVGLAMPIETLRDVRFAIRTGAVLRSSNALERLAATSWIVIDEHEALHRTACDVAGVRTKWLEEARLLPAMAAAGTWLGDERGPALVRFCRGRGVVVRTATLRDIDGDAVAIDFGNHLIRLRGRPVVAGAAPPPLIVEVDGVEVGGVRFARNDHLEAADAVRWLQQRGLRVFLASQRAGGGLATALGVDRFGEGMNDDEKVRILRELRGQGFAAAYVDDGLAHAPLPSAVHLSISLGGADAAAVGVEWGLSDIVLMAPSIAALPTLYALARDSAQRKNRARYAVTVPNLLCVAGAFAFGFTPMVAVLLSNFGTSLAYNSAKRGLHRTAETRLDGAW